MTSGQLDSTGKIARYDEGVRFSTWIVVLHVDAHLVPSTNVHDWPASRITRFATVEALVAHYNGEVVIAWMVDDVEEVEF